MKGFLQGSWVTAAQTAQSTTLSCLKASFVSCSCGPTRKLFPNFIPLTITKPIFVFILSWIYPHMLPTCFPVLSSFSTRACWCLPQLTPKYLWRTIPSLLSPQLSTSDVACVCLGQLSMELPLPEQTLGSGGSVPQLSMPLLLSIQIFSLKSGITPSQSLLCSPSMVLLISL